MQITKKLVLSVVIASSITSPLVHAHAVMSMWNKHEQRAWIISGAALCAVLFALLAWYNVAAQKKIAPVSDTVAPAAVADQSADSLSYDSESDDEADNIRRKWELQEQRSNRKYAEKSKKISKLLEKKTKQTECDIDQFLKKLRKVAAEKVDENEKADREVAAIVNREKPKKKKREPGQFTFSDQDQALSELGELAAPRVLKV